MMVQWMLNWYLFPYRCKVFGSNYNPFVDEDDPKGIIVEGKHELKNGIYIYFRTLLICIHNAKKKKWAALHRWKILKWIFLSSKILETLMHLFSTFFCRQRDFNGGVHRVQVPHLTFCRGPMLSRFLQLLPVWRLSAGVLLARIALLRAYERACVWASVRARSACNVKCSSCSPSLIAVSELPGDQALS